MFSWIRQICTKINSIKGYINVMSRGQQDKDRKYRKIIK